MLFSIILKQLWGTFFGPQLCLKDQVHEGPILAQDSQEKIIVVCVEFRYSIVYINHWSTCKWQNNVENCVFYVHIYCSKTPPFNKNAPFLYFCHVWLKNWIWPQHSPVIIFCPHITICKRNILAKYDRWRRMPPQLKFENIEIRLLFFLSGSSVGQ